MKFPQFLILISGWIAAFVINLLWRDECEQINDEWAEHCEELIESWNKLCLDCLEEEDEENDKEAVK